MARSGGPFTPSALAERASGKLSVVVPCYNEAAGLDGLFERLLPVLEELGVPFEIVCIDDGSRDETWGRLARWSARSAALRCLRLSRNFGKEAALSAGIDVVDGSGVVLIDADLQHPPELIPTLVARWREGIDMVYATRTSRNGDSLLRRVVTRAYYWAFGRLSEVTLPSGAGDFRLMDRCIVEALRDMPERVRFMKGLYAWVGFSHAGVEFDPPPRRAGASTMSLRRLTRFGFDGIVAFSRLPLILAAWLGAVVAVPALLIGIWLLVRTLAYGIDVPGYASTIVAVMVLGGAQLLTLGLLGAYVGRLYEETKRRPLYIVRESLGAEGGSREPP